MLAGSLVASSTLVGCGEDEAPVVVAPPPPPPPPPPAPRMTPIAELMAKHNIDPRVRLPEELAPDNDPARVAVLQFFDAFTRGDASIAATMLSAPDRLELERLEEQNRWAPATEAITRVDVRTGANSTGEQCALAVFHTGTTFQPQLWTYELGAATEFAAEPTPPGIMDQLSGENWIVSWYDILAAELAKAEEPDEKIVMKQVNHDSSGGDGAEEGGSGDTPTGRPTRRGGGGGPGRRPAGDPIDPPRLTPGGM